MTEYKSSLRFKILYHILNEVRKAERDVKYIYIPCGPGAFNITRAGLNMPIIYVKFRSETMIEIQDYVGIEPGRINYGMRSIKKFYIYEPSFPQDIIKAIRALLAEKETQLGKTPWAKTLTEMWDSQTKTETSQH